MFDWHQSLEGFVTESRRAQGLPDRVEDAAALATVARLLGNAAARPHPEDHRRITDGSVAASA
jgi:hypothetical protein